VGVILRCGCGCSHGNPCCGMATACACNSSSNCSLPSQQALQQAKANTVMLVAAVKEQKRLKKQKKRARKAAAALGAGPVDSPPKRSKRPADITAISIEAAGSPSAPDTKRVSLGEPGETPKVVHEVENLNTTPLAVREERAAADEAAAAVATQAALHKLVAHATAVAEKAEERGGFTATKGGLALVGLVARTVAAHPALGVKNLYKECCSTLGETPSRGKAPASREVRKIIAALRAHKSLEALMGSTKVYSNVGRRALLVQKKQSEGAKFADGKKKLFIGNLAWSLQHEGGEETLRKFFRKKGELTDIVLLKDKEDKFAGTGFIEFATPEAAMEAITLHGTECAGRPINIHFARPRSSVAPRGKQHQSPAQQLSERPDDCSTCFVANLPWDVDESAVLAWANECGKVANIRWLTDAKTGRFKGCGYIEFEGDGSGAAAAVVDKMVERNGRPFSGRPVRVDYALPKGSG
jgi:RNA recognition motif-containing protein